MLRFFALPLLLSLASPLYADSSTNVKVQTTVVTPRVIVGTDAPPAPVRRSRAATVRARHDTRRRGTRLITASHHVPRPLSPGEFGRTRPGV